MTIYFPTKKTRKKNIYEKHDKFKKITEWNFIFSVLPFWLFGLFQRKHIVKPANKASTANAGVDQTITMRKYGNLKW